MLINIPYTLAQVRAATKEQIITVITNRLNNMTKRQIVLWLMEGIDKYTDSSVCKYRPDGQIESRVDVDRDIETEAIIETRTVTWTYYPTGEVDTITIVKTDAAGNKTRKTVKHFTDGRQPRIAEGE